MSYLSQSYNTNLHPDKECVNELKCTYELSGLVQL